MNRTMLILGAGTLVFGSASAYLYSDLRETRAQAAALQAHVAQLEPPAEEGPRATPPERPVVPTNPFTAAPTVSEVPAPISEVPIRRAAAPSLQPVSQPPVAMLGGNAPALVVNARAAWERSRKLFENPEYREAMQRQQKMMMPRVYPDLQTALALDDQQADQFFELLAEQQMQSMTTSSPVPFGPGTDEAATREWQKQQQRLQTEKEAQIAALLGDAKLQQWKNYQSTMPARMQIRELRSTLEGAGLPLQQDQAERLITAITVEQQRAMSEKQTVFNGIGPAMVGPTGIVVQAGSAPADRTALFDQQIEQTKQQQQRLHNAASPHLTSQQLEYFERMQAAQLEMQLINLKMMRAQMEAEARGDAPPVNQINQAFVAPGATAER